ncbi:MAG: WYL domain-containing protein [Holophaga sp.]|nr:WYL domain-containing protein [Holophaga sp.]
MAPRKTSLPKSDPKPELLEEPKAPVRSRVKKAAKEVPAALSAPSPEPAAPAKAPAAKKRAAARVPAGDQEKVRKPRKTKAAAAAVPAPAEETPVVVPEPVPDPVAVSAAPAEPAPSAPAMDPSLLVTDQARAVLLAIQEGRAVELLFVDAENNPPRTFEPRQLIFDTFAKGWYVWGWDRRYNAERHHLLSLIAQVNPVEGLGRAAQGPYKEGTPANLIGGWLGGEAIRVKAVLLKQWIFAVRQAPAPFPEFAIEDLEEGKAQVSFTATDLRAITRWVMQFGDGIQILEPQRLLDRIKQVGLAWGGKPGPAPSAPSQAPKQPRQEHRSEHKEPHRSEHRFEPRPEQAAERKVPDQPRRVREAREPRESHEAPKPSKAGKFEIRIDRL